MMRRVRQTGRRSAPSSAAKPDVLDAHRVLHSKSSALGAIMMVSTRRAHGASALSTAIALLAVVDLLSEPRAVCAQELEPRAYSAAPVGTNFLVGGYGRATGSITPVPSVPVTGV